ncbi:MAG: hypothetical protein MUO60_14045 [Clostridiaceae bacterium]|nr:hypothetical protein [Clostridiaceae bacterium]
MRIETQLKVIRVIIWGLFLILVFTIFLGAFQAFPQKCKFDNQGFENFITYFSSSIKVGALFIIVLTIYLTLQRMHQTEWQNYIISDNNRFNNFYKHREEYLKFFQEKRLFIDLAKVAGYTLNQLLLDHYRIYYYKRDQEFKKEIKASALESIRQFINTIKNENLDNINMNIEDLTLDTVSKPNGCFTYHYYEIMRLIEHYNKNELSHFNKLTAYQIPVFKQLLAIYYNYLIILEVITFDGQTLIEFGLSEFATGFKSICKKLDLERILYSG